MHLPRPIYQSLPIAYGAIGLMFVAGSVYLGLETGLERFYFGVGVLCIGAGFYVRSLRTNPAQRSAQATSAEPRPD